MGRAEEYDRRFRERELAGLDVHGEANLVASLGPRSVLDAGCGTGRVAIELARRGIDVVGVDIDREMLEAARRKAPHIPWVEGDLATIELREGEGLRRFDIAVLAGNVMIFVAPSTEAAVVANVARHLRVGGRLIAGFQLQPGGYGVEEHDAAAAAAGLHLLERWAGWDREPWEGFGPYAVSVHGA